MTKIYCTCKNERALLGHMHIIFESSLSSSSTAAAAAAATATTTATTLTEQAGLHVAKKLICRRGSSLDARIVVL